MNICLVTSTFLPELTGVSTHLQNLANHFSRLGHKVLLLCPDYGVEKEIYPDYLKYRGELFPNVTVRPAPSQKNRRRPESVNYREGTSWKLEEAIGDFRPDIIQVDDPDRIYGVGLFGLEETIAYNGAIGVAYAKANNIPVIGFYQTNYAAFADYYIPKDVPTPYRMDPAGVYRKVYGLYDAVLCSCGDAYRRLKEHGLEKVRQGTYMGVHEAVLQSDESSPLIPRSKKIKILYSGRFDGGKDVKIVVDIFRKAHGENSQLQLFLAGSGLRDTMEYVSGVCSETPDIHYVGNLDMQALAKVYNSVDIYFSPHGTDTLGLSIIEAMSKGLPVVASDRGGPASLIDSGRNGILCAGEEAFVRHILALSADKGYRRAIGEQAENDAKKYSGKNCAANLISTYGELIERLGQNECLEEEECIKQAL